MLHGAALDTAQAVSAAVLLAFTVHLIIANVRDYRSQK